jgi:hypothetical protein
MTKMWGAYGSREGHHRERSPWKRSPQGGEVPASPGEVTSSWLTYESPPGAEGLQRVVLILMTE